MDARPRTLLGLLLLLPLLAAGCGLRGGKEPSLTPQDQALVAELVALYKLDILELSDPPRAQALQDSLRVTNRRDELRARLAPLAEDPRRGQRVLQAVYDSLKAARTELFPAPSQ